VKFVPQQLARRFAAVRLQALRGARNAESSHIAEWCVKTHSKLAAYVPYLLLHQPADAERQQPQSSLRGLLTARLRLAETGDWAALIEAAARNEAHCRTALREAGPKREPTRQQCLERAAERAADGGLRAAAQALRPSGTLPPGAETTAKVAALYSKQQQEPLPPRPSHAAIPWIKPKTVAARVRAARGGSTPRPYGERTGHVRSLLVSPRGLEDLTAWVNFWLGEGLSTAFRQPWLHCGLVALDKGGGKPRPIVLQESLLKLVTGCVAQASAPRLRAAAGDWQRGVYHPGGAPQLVWELRQAVAADTSAVLAGTDCRNAFGCAKRAPALRIADAECPQFGRLLRSLWEDVHRGARAGR